MLLHVDQRLYDILSSLPVWSESTEDATALRTAPTDPIPKVVRAGTSEYDRLVDQLDEPMLAIELEAEDFDRPWRALRPGDQIGRFSSDAQTHALMSPYPHACTITYNLRLRSPDELWLRRINRNLRQAFSPNGGHARFETFEIPFGNPEAADTPVKQWVVEYILGNAQGVREIDEEIPRSYQMLLRLTVKAWLLYDSSVTVLRTMYQRSEVAFEDLGTDEGLGTVEIEEEP